MSKNKIVTVSIAEILERHSDIRSNSRQAVDDLLKSLPAPVQSCAKKHFQNPQSPPLIVSLLVAISALSLLLVGLLAVGFLSIK